MEKVKPKATPILPHAYGEMLLSTSPQPIGIVKRGAEIRKLKKRSFLYRPLNFYVETTRIERLPLMLLVYKI